MKTVNNDIFNDVKKVLIPPNADEAAVATAPRMDKTSYSLDEVSAMYGVDTWTIRMWINRFDIPMSCPGPFGERRLTRERAAQIGTISRLTKVGGLTVEDVRQYIRAGGRGAFQSVAQDK